MAAPTTGSLESRSGAPTPPPSSSIARETTPPQAYQHLNIGADEAKGRDWKTIGAVAVAVVAIAIAIFGALCATNVLPMELLGGMPGSIAVAAGGGAILLAAGAYLIHHLRSSAETDSGADSV